MSWIPKSTVPATLAGVMLTEATALGPNYKDYQVYGLQIQTTTILAIIVCEPLGSFLVDYFVPKFFTLDPITTGKDNLEKIVKISQMPNVPIKEWDIQRSRNNTEVPIITQTGDVIGEDKSSRNNLQNSAMRLDEEASVFEN